jgi:hypothetical protein
MKKLKNVRETDLPKLEALLTQPRRAQMLLDLTMNRKEVITEDNIEEILEMMRKTTAQEEREASKREIEEVKRRARADVDAERGHREKLAESLAGRDGELADARSLLERNEKVDKGMIQHWAEDAAKFERKLVNSGRLILVVLAAMLVATGLILDTDAMPAYAGILAWIAAALTFVFLVGSLIPGFPNVFRPGIVRMRDKRFRRKVEDAGRADLLGSHDVDWENVVVRRR